MRKLAPSVAEYHIQYVGPTLITSAYATTDPSPGPEGDNTTPRFVQTSPFEEVAYPMLQTGPDRQPPYHVLKRPFSTATEPGMAFNSSKSPGPTRGSTIPFRSTSGAASVTAVPVKTAPEEAETLAPSTKSSRKTSLSARATGRRTSANRSATSTLRHMTFPRWHTF